MTETAPDAARTRRGRLMLIALFVLFFGSAFGAGLLRLSGWMPAGLKNHGELLQPPADLRQARLALADGSAYAWNPAARTWRIVVAPPADCREACVKLAQDLDKVWQLFGRRADHVHILWIGTPPADARRDRAWRVVAADPALRAGLPRVDDPAGPPVYVIDPNGFVILRYPAGFDPGHLREDVGRLLKLK